MYEFFVNGRIVMAAQDGALLDFLRDELRLTSPKDGCHQGACGACMVLIDGKPKKSCVVKLSSIVGSSVLSIEGLSAREAEVYGYAFAKAGAVQCGFCTPGMVISAKALIDSCPSPTPEQVKDALKGNICRCTGYQKIVDAVLLCADIFSGRAAIEPGGQGVAGHSLTRVDALEKTLGRAIYANDMYAEGMLYGGALRTAHPRAKVVSIDVSKALAHPRAAAVVTAKDLPGAKKIGHIVQDWDILIAEGECTRCIGDAIALLCATDKKALEEMKALIEVQYEVLPPITTPEEALLCEEKGELIHERGNVLYREHIARGDAEGAISGAAHVITNTYELPFTEHAFLEPESALAFMENGGVVIYSGDQGVYQTRHECAMATGLDEERVKVVSAMVGGGFGGKEDMTVQPIAAILALKTGRPVKVTLSRDESIRVHPKRHAMKITLTTACDEKGYLLASKAYILADTGAYASLGNPVVQRACTHIGGPYNYQKLEVEALAVYTNNPPGGAFRGFGVAQACFACEGNINELAELVGISAWQIRMQNAIRPGLSLPNGQIADENTALVQTLEAVRQVYEAHPRSGIACALKNSGVGVGLKDVGRCNIAVKRGAVEIYSSAACIGQGLATAMVQIVCTETGLPPSAISVATPSTDCPDSGSTTASRQTLFAGEATRRAAQALSADLQNGGEQALEALEGRIYRGEFSVDTDPITSCKPHPYSHAAYGYATHVVMLGEDEKVERVIAAHDAGKAINPTALEGQIEGGVIMSLGYALTEDFPLKSAVPTAKFGTLGLFKANQAPPVEVVLVTANTSGPAYGAKGIGEISAIPTAPAVAHAYVKRDNTPRHSLPLRSTPYAKGWR